MSKLLSLFNRQGGASGQGVDTSTLDQTARILERNRRFEFFLMQRQKELENDLAAEAPVDRGERDDLLAMPMWQSDPAPEAGPIAEVETTTDKPGGDEDITTLLAGFDDEFDSMFSLSSQPPPPGAVLDRATSASLEITTSTEPSDPQTDQFAATDQPSTLDTLGTDQGDDWASYFDTDDESESDQTAAEVEPDEDQIDAEGELPPGDDELALPASDPTALPQTTLEDLYPAEAADELEAATEDDEAVDIGASLRREWDTALSGSSEPESEPGDLVD
jgi:hypothetical protein